MQLLAILLYLPKGRKTGTEKKLLDTPRFCTVIKIDYLINFIFSTQRVSMLPTGLRLSTHSEQIFITMVPFTAQEACDIQSSLI